MEDVGDILAQAIGIKALRIRIPKRMISEYRLFFSEYLSNVREPSSLTKIRHKK